MIAETNNDLLNASKAFEWLAGAFLNVPNKELLMSLDPAWFKSFGSDSHLLAETLYSCVEKYSDDEIKQIAIDHTSLFAACRPNAPYPYESVFTGKAPLLMQDARTEVLPLYRERGYSLPTVYGFEPEDHVSFELGFVSYMYSKAACETDDHEKKAYLVAIQEFKENHLINWIPAFTQRITDEAETDFMARVAALTAGIVK